MNDMDVLQRAKEKTKELIEMGEIELAKGLVEQYKVILRDDVEVYSIMGIIAMIEGDMEQAESIFLEGYNIDNSNFNLLYNLGYLYRAIDNHNTSVYYYKRALLFCNEEVARNEIEEYIGNNPKEKDTDYSIVNELKNNRCIIKNILFVQSVPDIRTNKIAQILHDKDINIDILYLMVHPKDVYKGLVLPYKNIFRFEDIKKTIRFVNESEYDIIFSCNEPDYLTALLINTNKPVIHDCHDMMSLRGDTTNEQITIEYLANSNCDGNIYVTDLVGEIAKQMFSLENKPVMILNNYVLKKQLPKKKLKKLSDMDGEVHCVYEGGLTDIKGHHRNIENVFLKLAEIKIHVHYYIPFENKYYRELAKKSKYLHYEETKEPDELIEEMTKYDIGLTILNVTDRNKTFLDTTFPNKAWEYLAAGLPIIFSNLTSFDNFLKRYKVGEILNLEGDLERQINRIKEISIPNNFLELNKLCMDDYADRLIQFICKVKNKKRITQKLLNEKSNNLKSKTNSIIMSGSYGSGNIGDEYISFAIKKSVIGKDIDKIMCYNKEICEKFLRNVRYYNQNDFRDASIGIEHSNGLIFGGGGLFYDYGDINQTNIRYRLLLATYALSIGKPIYILNVGTNGIFLDLNRDLVRNIFNYADYISVRDIDSLNELRDLGVTNNITLSSDNVFSMLPQMIKVKSSSNKKKVLGIQMRPIMEIVSNNKDKDQQVYHEIAKMIDYFVERHGYFIRFFSTYIPYDSIAYNGIIGYLKNKSAFQKVETFDIKNVMNMISECECFIGMSLHSLIFASMLNTKFIGIGYHPKIKSFLNDIGHSKYHVQYPDFKSEELINLVEELLDSKIDYDVKNEYFYELCTKSYIELKEALNKPYRYKDFKVENENMQNFINTCGINIL